MLSKLFYKRRMTENLQFIKREYREFVSYLYINNRNGHQYFHPMPPLEILSTFYSSSFMRGESDPTPATEFTPELIQIAKGVIDYMNTFKHRIQWNVFDVGCGYGGLVWAMQQIGHNAEGNELNQKWIKEANYYCQNQLHYGDLPEILPSLDKKFDLFHISHTLEHIPNPKKTLLSVKKYLSADGLIYVNVPNTKSLRYLSYGRESGIDFGNFPMHLNFFTPRSMKELGEKCGLKLIQMETRPFDEIDPENHKEINDFRFKTRLLGGELFALFAQKNSEIAKNARTEELYRNINQSSKQHVIVNW